jgi:hypothetical protein
MLRYRKWNKEHFLFICLIILLSIPVIFPLTKPGFFVSDDGEWMIIRLSAFYEMLAAGQFPVRFLSRLNYGYGYPVANFLYPGFLYLGAILHFLGLSFVGAVKMIFALSVIGSGIFAYLFLAKLFDRPSAIVGSIFYVYAPYHLFDLYQRGSIGEMLALSILPFVLWQIERRSFVLISLGIASLVLSHNTLFLLFLPAIVFYMLLVSLMQMLKRRLIMLYGFSLLFGIGLSAFFWLPAVYDLQYTVFSKVTVSEWQRYFANASEIGIALILSFILSILLFAIKRASLKNNWRTVFFLGFGLFSLLFSTSFSTIIWRFLPVAFVQFPFRFLSLAIFCGAWLSAFSCSLFHGKTKLILGIIFSLSLLLPAKNYLDSIVYINKGEGFYTTNMATTTVRDEYMPRWVKIRPLSYAAERILFEEERIVRGKLVTKPDTIIFSVDVDKPTRVVVNTIYFPGWEVQAGNEIIPIAYHNDRGLITFTLPKGNYTVKVHFTETTLRLISDLISLLSFALLLIIALYQKLFRHQTFNL